MGHNLKGKRVAVLVTDGFEQIELTSPVDALKQAGAQTAIVALKAGQVKGWNRTDWGDKFDVDETVSDASSKEYDALLLPGGVMSPDKLRMDQDALRFVRSFFEQHKPVAAICHGPWPLIDAGVVKGRTVTSYPSLRQDLVNAGATWVDETVVVDQGLVTSRNPDDLPAFNDKLCEEVAEGKHKLQHA